MATPFTPFDFEARRRQDRTPSSQRIFDPVSETVGQMRQQNTRMSILQGGNPDKTAQVTRLSRWTGDSPLLIEGREDQAQKLVYATALEKSMASNPLLSWWFDLFPRNAVAAQDDAKSMGMVGYAWDTIKKVPASIKAGVLGSGEHGAKINWWFFGGLGDAWDELTTLINPGSMTRGELEERKAARAAYWGRGIANATSAKEAARPRYIGAVQEGLLGGVESVPISLTATLAGVLTRNPAVSASLLGGQVGGAAYADARIAGRDIPSSIRYGIIQGGTETGTEFLPQSRLLGALANRSGVFKTIASYLAAELPGEMSATLIQGMSEWATLNPDKPYSAWVAGLPRDMAMTVLGVLGGGTLHVAAAKSSVAIYDRVTASQQGRAQGQAIDQLGKAAQESKLRQRDPEAYNELIRHMGEQSGAEHVFVPAEAVREYMQSDSYDPFSDPFESYRDDVEEAAAVGGDVVLPVEFALGTLPGTAAWSAVKDEMRLEQGGLSAREAVEFETAMADVAGELEALAGRVDAQETRIDEMMQTVQDKLQNAGFTPYVARQHATVIVQRIVTRAARLGLEVQGDEFSRTEVRQVLPPELAKARQADAIDLVINALRKGKSSTVQAGPSLLDWIAARGGINDPGGDLASMGLNDWHRAKPFRRKLIRPYDPAAAMGGISGAGDYGVDSVMRGAIEAGYFPELNGVELEPGVSTLDTQLLLDAIGAELAGSPRYAEDARVDAYRAAAEELDQVLMERGLDPEGLSDEELRGVIERLDAERADGDWFEQMPDQIEIDGVMRSTRNSEGQPLAGSEEGVRGRIQFMPDGRSIIELFQGRNLSTLVHELGHDYLEQLRADAPFTEQLTADWQAVQDWFAANGHPVKDGVIPVEAHEMWARGFERYLMEGKAPSSALQKVFETFRGWLISVYKTVTGLRAPITSEIREVMDRLLATDDEIAAMRDAQRLEPLFKDAAGIGMTDQEFVAYQAETAVARDEARAGLLEKTMAEVRRRETDKYRTARVGVEQEIAEEVDARPLFKALRNLKSMPIDKGWLEREMGLDVFDLIPRRVPPIYKAKGAHPDEVAEMSGYQSGRQMVDALIGAEAVQRQAVEQGDKRGLRDRVIQTETDMEMGRRYGDPLNDGTIEREALEAVHNERQGEVFAAEVRALARRTGQRPTPYRIARDWARGKVRRGVYQVEASAGAIQRHQRAVAKAGRQAEEAYLAGKFDEALRFKQQQMVSSALLAEAKAAHDEVEAARKRLDKIARQQTSKSIDQDYLDQAHALLEAVDLRPRSQKSIDKQGKWEAWAAEREAEGFDVVVPGAFEATLGTTHWSRLPVETLLALNDAVAQVVHLGRLKQKLIDGKEAREFEEVVREAVDGAGNIKGKPPKGMDEGGMWEAIKGGFASIDASLIKMETAFDWLDGGDPNGVFNRIVFRPIAEAQGTEQDMLREYFGKIKALFEAVPGEQVSRWGDKVVTPFIERETGRPWAPNRQRLIAAALNIGNEGNLQRLSDGYGYDPAALEGFLVETLTAEEWQLVQGIWDTIETLWPSIEALEKRVNGVAPDKVEPREIVTPAGTLRGGYYPAVYDTSKNYRAEENRGRESDLFEGGYTRATTRSSATKARAEQVNAPILLDLGVINRHLGEVIHDITHREPVMQANKFLTNERVMRAVDEALGPDLRKQFRPWVKFVANSWAMERAGNEGFGKWLGALRANVTAVGMGLRATTMVTQISGYSNSIEVVGEKWVAEAVARTSAEPIKTFNFVLEKSPEVRHRMETLDRDIRTELAKLTSANPVSRGLREIQDARRFFFHGIGYMDRVVSVPTWLAAYNKALAGGADEQDAIYAGDKAVRLSQGAGAPKDMAAIQRGTGKWGEALKLMTMFYTYFSAMYQRERTLYRDATGEDVRRPRNMPALVARAWWLLIVPPLLTEVLKASLGGGDAPEDDEWWAQWTLRKILSNAIGPIPMARDLFEPAWNAARGGTAFNPQISPVNRALSTWFFTAGDLGKIVRGEETKRATKNALESIGYATGLVPGQVASAVQFLVDVGNGDVDPEGFGDWVEGLSTGKLKDE